MSVAEIETGWHTSPTAHSQYTFSQAWKLLAQIHQGNKHNLQCKYISSRHEHDEPSLKKIKACGDVLIFFQQKARLQISLAYRKELQLYTHPHTCSQAL